MKRKLVDESGWVLIAQDTDIVIPESTQISIPTDQPIFLGRKEIQTDDKRISRTQLEIRCTEMGIEVARRGANLSGITIDQFEYTPLEKDKWYPVQKGQYLSLLDQSILFQLQKIGGDKKKVSKPVCKYGSDCYRKNPQHFLEYDHPGINNLNTDDISSDDENVPVISQEQVKSITIKEQPKNIDVFKKDDKDTKNNKMKIDTPAPSTNSKIMAQPKKINDEDVKKNPPQPLPVSKPPKISDFHEKPIVQKPLKTNIFNKPTTLNNTTTKTTLQDLLKLPAYTISTNNLQPRLAFPCFCSRGKGFSKDDVVNTLTNSILNFNKLTKSQTDLIILIEEDDPIYSHLSQIQKRSEWPSNCRLMRGNINQININDKIQIIANESNWRFSSHYPGINKYLSNLSGAELFENAKAMYSTGKVGNAYPVILSRESKLRDERNIIFVIHIVTPTLNDKKSNACTDKKEAIRLLSECYTNMFASYLLLSNKS